MPEHGLPEHLQEQREVSIHDSRCNAEMTLPYKMTHGSFCRGGSFLCITPADVITLADVSRFFFQAHKCLYIISISSKSIFKWEKPKCV